MFLCVLRHPCKLIMNFVLRSPVFILMLSNSVDRWLQQVSAHLVVWPKDPIWTFLTNWRLLLVVACKALLSRLRLLFLEGCQNLLCLKIGFSSWVTRVHGLLRLVTLLSLQRGSVYLRACLSFECTDGRLALMKRLLLWNNIQKRWWLRRFFFCRLFLLESLHHVWLVKRTTECVRRGQ